MEPALVNGKCADFHVYVHVGNIGADVMNLALLRLLTLIVVEMRLGCLQSVSGPTARGVTIRCNHLAPITTLRELGPSAQDDLQSIAGAVCCTGAKC